LDDQQERTVACWISTKGVLAGVDSRLPLVELGLGKRYAFRVSSPARYGTSRGFGSRRCCRPVRDGDVFLDGRWVSDVAPSLVAGQAHRSFVRGTVGGTVRGRGSIAAGEWSIRRWAFVATAAGGSVPVVPRSG
jgi:hypothetical protein